jgi:tRNA(Ile2) C34 agmatinyltransferase TiaS
VKSPKKKAPKIIAICLSKATPLTAERRKAIENQDAETQATVAFLDLTDAIAAQNPALDRAECRRSAQFILEDTARQIREGHYVIDHSPNRLSLAFSDADDFMQLVRSLPKGTVIGGHSDDGL